MKYLRKFNTAEELSAWQSSSEYAKPNVVLADGVISYNLPKLGVYIQHINGTLYDEAGWISGGFGNDAANGVAVIDSRASFVIAKTNITFMEWASNYLQAVDGVLLTSDRDTAKADYKGAENTKLIVAGYDTGKAAYSCANYEFPNGQKGYLPALGEWVVAKSYKDAIDEAVLLIGGDAIAEKAHWSSTQQGSQTAWTHNWASASGTGSSSKENVNRVRAFTTL
jgi:hypothetical protein